MEQSMGTMDESPDPELLALGFTQSDLSSVRRLVEDEAAAAGLPPERIADVVFAVNEIATNALRHGAEPACIRVWHQTGRLLCEVRDSGNGMPDSFAPGRKPALHSGGGFGLWAARQLCEAIEFRADSSGTVVRVHASWPATG
jgi:anti-sigma regulatory factor (Ser/Thr protein kinase)